MTLDRKQLLSFGMTRTSVGGTPSTNVLTQGTVPMAAWWDQRAEETVHQVARVRLPPIIRKNIDDVAIDWYAVFEFRDGRWYCTFFCSMLRLKLGAT